MGAIPSFSGREGEKALSDLQYKEGRKEPDFVLEMNLRQWMMVRPRLLDPEVQPLLKRLHEFARHVQSAGFGRALKNLAGDIARSEEHTSELQSLAYLVCRLLLEKKKK